MPLRNSLTNTTAHFYDMASAGDFEQKAKEVEALAASSRHVSSRTAFQKLAEEYSALAQKQRDLNAKRIAGGLANNS
jgi:hypothetical protein